VDLPADHPAALLPAVDPLVVGLRAVNPPVADLLAVDLRAVDPPVAGLQPV